MSLRTTFFYLNFVAFGLFVNHVQGMTREDCLMDWLLSGKTISDADCQELFLESSMLFERQQFDVALVKLERIIASSMNSSWRDEARYLAALCKFKQKDFCKALWYLDSIELFSRHANILYLKGAVCYCLKDFKNAECFLTEVGLELNRMCTKEEILILEIAQKLLAQVRPFNHRYIDPFDLASPEEKIRILGYRIREVTSKIDLGIQELSKSLEQFSNCFKEAGKSFRS